MMVVMTAMQLAFIWFWIATYSKATVDLRMLHIRTFVVLGFGWYSCTIGAATTGLGLVVDWLVAAHVFGMAMAVWNFDERIFKNKLFDTFKEA
jgi:hypothetical protein